MTPIRIAFAALLLLGSVASPAAAELTTPSGQPCWYTNDQAGPRVDGGPFLLVDEDDPTVLHTATLTCSVQRDHQAHSAPDLVSATSAPGTGEVHLLPTTVPAVDGYPRYVCTRLDVAGEPTLYWEFTGYRTTSRWTTDPAASCEPTFFPMDDPPQNAPQTFVYSALTTALGESDVAVAVVEPVICGEPALDPVTDAAWRCGAPTTDWGQVSFVRAATGAVLRAHPFGWTCTDVHSGLVVTHGSALVTPDPGVSCAPPPGYTVYCDWLQVSGHLAPVTLGRVDVHASCGGGEGVTRRLTAVHGSSVVWSNGFGDGPPLRCSATEDTSGPTEPSYTVDCYRMV